MFKEVIDQLQGDSTSSSTTCTPQFKEVEQLQGDSTGSGSTCTPQSKEVIDILQGFLSHLF
jgi:hypothetical protein